MKIIRNVLLKILGLKGYLTFISKIYVKFVLNEFFKKQCKELFFLKKIIKKDFLCIDLGANLGYYSTYLSKLTGDNGQVLAVEPIPLFGEIWKKNVLMSKSKNLRLFPYALGGENKIVKMGTPQKNGRLHHGMTKIVSTAKEEYVNFYEVEMRIPDEIFADIDRLDFVKCDVEGYESQVFLNFRKTIEKFRPIVQSELGGEKNRRTVYDFFKELEYSPKYLNKQSQLIDVDENNIKKINSDFYFFPNK
ncbi:MAG: FkbM family methyltransferase [Bacteroidetes bacterium]|nr:FkbM family methyltransferase [Bacteroidota bacterium]